MRPTPVLETTLASQIFDHCVRSVVAFASELERFEARYPGISTSTKGDISQKELLVALLWFYYHFYNHTLHGTFVSVHSEYMRFLGVTDEAFQREDALLRSRYEEYHHAFDDHDFRTVASAITANVMRQWVRQPDPLLIPMIGGWLGTDVKEFSAVLDSIEVVRDSSTPKAQLLRSGGAMPAREEILQGVLAVVASSARQGPAHFTSAPGHPQTFLLGKSSLNVSDEQEMAALAWGVTSEFLSGSDELSREQLLVAVRAGEDTMLGSYLLEGLEQTKLLPQLRAALSQGWPPDSVGLMARPDVRRYLEYCAYAGMAIRRGDRPEPPNPG